MSKEFEPPAKAIPGPPAPYPEKTPSREQYEAMAYQPDEQGWLIESDGMWLFFTEDRRPAWSHDSLKAVRFSRKADAETIMFALNLIAQGWLCRATEHRWGL
jgi:hypothetical protein